MNPSLTDTLCTRCGLCCDGSLFGDVELASRAEATRLELLGLDVEDDDSAGGLLLQPCAALRGTRCGVYQHRPGCCRTFECRLLKDVRCGAIPVEDARRRIADAVTRARRVRGLLAKLGRRGSRLPLRERVAESLATETNRRPRADRIRAQLAAEMARQEALLRERFLGDAAS
jgi:Fe-S-cluster containining protein